MDNQNRLQTALAYVDDHLAEFLEDLTSFLRIPSVSALPEYHSAVWQAAQWLCDEVSDMGFPHARLIETAGYPLVAAEWLEAPGKPTILIYGHYDVQPPDGDEPWRQADPFIPVRRGDDLFARGASDDKGQLLALLKALKSLYAVNACWPVNLRILIEGEEESGGASIASYLEQHASETQCDAVLIADTSMPAPAIPALVYGVRGLLYTEIRVRGAHRDLHSGEFGGIAPNPLHALAHILSGLAGPDGHISIPELYEQLDRAPEEEQRVWRSSPLDIPSLLQSEMRITSLWGERGVTPYERLWTRPTLDIHGIRGGFIGKGAKTVIPAEATAKVSLRLPPELRLSPAAVLALLQKRVADLCPTGIRADVVEIHSGEGVLVPRGNRYLRIAASAIEAEWGTTPILTRTGGSIPVGELFQRLLGVPVVFMGVGLPDDNIHAPNEKFHLPHFRHLIRQTVRYLDALGGEALV